MWKFAFRHALGSLYPDAPKLDSRRLYYACQMASTDPRTGENSDSDGPLPIRKALKPNVQAPVFIGCSARLWGKG